MNTKYAILILSSDKYHDLWAPFFELFWKNWPNCPYTVYLGSNSRTFHHKRVKNILTGRDTNWSTSYKKILKQIPEKYIFVLLEDLFITSKIDTTLFIKCFNFADSNEINHLNFTSLPSFAITSKNPKFVPVKKFMPYRAHVIGFWKKDYLYDLLLEGENPWNFEIMGSYRTSYDDGFYSTKYPIYSSIHLVKKNKWIQKGLQYCKDNSIGIDISKRNSLSIFELLFYNLQEYYFKFIYFHVDWKVRVGVMNILRRALLSY